MFTLRQLFRRIPDEMAAIDLGSNSFHMVLARQEQGELRLRDRLRETVRLGFGLEAICDLYEKAGRIEAVKLDGLSSDRDIRERRVR